MIIMCTHKQNAANVRRDVEEEIEGFDKGTNLGSLFK